MIALGHDTRELYSDRLPDGLDRVFLMREPETLFPGDDPLRDGAGIRRDDGTLIVNGTRVGRAVLIVDCTDFTVAAGPVSWTEVVYEIAGRQ